LSTRILVVDDDPLILRSVERILSRAGYEVVTATDVAEAVRYASKMPIQAALVDYVLSHEDGLQVLARLREIQPACLRILMTGRRDFPMVVDAVNRGEVLRVVRKPFEPTGLLQIIGDAFASARRMIQAATAQLNAVDVQEREMLDFCMNDGLLRLAVQPILSTADDKPVAYEALLRSSHSVLDTPLALLQVAERHSKINELGNCVFALAERWFERLPPSTGLFVNLHPTQLSDPERLLEALVGLVPFANRVTLEITERSPLYEIELWEKSVEAMTDAGFSLAIDDLGAGYNSLTMLAELQPRYIKLDMSLVRHIEIEPRKRRLVQLIRTFAEATNALTIAEGVETAEEAMVLKDCGIHLLQGYFYAAPNTNEAPLSESLLQGS
jgi:EAL domain-containing protein (putative c-di-GMP-specific phosphodiesterase class I)